MAVDEAFLGNEIQTFKSMKASRVIAGVKMM